MGMQDSAVKNEDCGHLFTVTANISLAIIWEIANKAQLLYVFLFPLAILHNGMEDAACRGKSISHLFASIKGKKKKKKDKKSLRWLF